MYLPGSPHLRLSALTCSTDAPSSIPPRQDGVACEPFPRKQMVGGESGVLFDMSYPTGVTAA